VHPIVIIVGLGLLYYALSEEDETEKTKKGVIPGEKDGSNRSSSGAGGQLSSADPKSDGNRSVIDFEKIVTEKMKGLENVFESKFDAFFDRVRDDLSGKSDATAGDGKSQSVENPPEKGDKKHGEKTKEKKASAPNKKGQVS
jgi:hypothetical protein